MSIKDEIRDYIKSGYTIRDIAIITGYSESWIRIEILRQAIDTYGADKQMLKTIEECGELTRAISRILTELSSGEGFTNKESENNLYEEIADVEIMLQQLKMIFKCEDKVNEQIEFKIKRLKERLEQ